METEFETQDLHDLYTKRDFSAGYGKEIVKAYRKRIQIIKAARDERDLYAIKGNRFEKLKGDRSHQRSLRLNDKMRLIIEIKEGTSKNRILVIGIEDYGAIRERAKLFESAPVKDLERRGWIKVTRKIIDLQHELSRFFDLPEIEKLRAAAKSSIQSSELTPEQIAWCVRALRLARSV